MAFGQVGQAMPFERPLEQEARAVEHKLSFDTNVEPSSLLFELPHVETTAVRWQAKVEAIVVRQVRGCLRPLALGEIRGRSDDSHPKVGPDPHCNHVLGNQFAGTDAGIVLSGYDVGQTV